MACGAAPNRMQWALAIPQPRCASAADCPTFSPTHLTHAAVSRARTERTDLIVGGGASGKGAGSWGSPGSRGSEEVAPASTQAPTECASAACRHTHPPGPTGAYSKQTQRKRGGPASPASLLNHQRTVRSVHGTSTGLRIERGAIEGLRVALNAALEGDAAAGGEEIDADDGDGDADAMVVVGRASSAAVSCWAAATATAAAAVVASGSAAS